MHTHTHRFLVLFAKVLLHLLSSLAMTSAMAVAFCAWGVACRGAGAGTVSAGELGEEVEPLREEGGSPHCTLDCKS